MNRHVKVLLAGNPNVGKSTLFNVLTGEAATVANYPGVTAEIYGGKLRHHDIDIEVIDLPGVYSLSYTGSEAEEAVFKFLLEEEYDVIIVITDAISLAKTMYLPISLLEYYPKIVIAVNMMDVADKRGLHIDLDGLSRELGVPVVGVSATKNIGVGVLLDRILEIAEKKDRSKIIEIYYGALEKYILKLSSFLRDNDVQKNTRWLSIKLLEGDEYIKKYIENIIVDEETFNRFLFRLKGEIEADLRVDPSIHIIRYRYSYIDKILKGKIAEAPLIKPRYQDILDKLYLSPVSGPLTTIITLFLVFLFVFSINTGFPLNIILDSLGYSSLAGLVETYNLVGILSFFFEYSINSIVSWMQILGVNPILISLFGDGIALGIGAVLTFFPLIFLVFLTFSALQDSGILARMAVSTDKLFRRFGLSGRSLFPAVLGLGCNVPAIISTRVIDNDAERISAALSVPFIPCQARLLVTVLIALAVIPNPLTQGIFIISIYILSFTIYLTMAFFFKRYMFKFRASPELIMDLPAYHEPNLKVMWWYSKTNSIHFLKKAGIYIFLLTILVWGLMHASVNGFITDLNPVSLSNSFAAILGRALAPIGRLVGLSDWRLLFGLEIGVLVKEMYISTISMLAGIVDPIEALRSLGLTIKNGIALALIFNIYIPCVATIAAIKVELKKWSYVLEVVLIELSLAFLLGFISYRILSLFGL